MVLVFELYTFVFYLMYFLYFLAADKARAAFNEVNDVYKGLEKEIK